MALWTILSRNLPVTEGTQAAEGPTDDSETAF